jgi:DNA polymerase-3 subunit delta
VSHAAYLISGDDAFLVSQALDDVLKDGGHEVEHVPPGADVGQVLESLRTPSLFGGRRVVVLRDVEQLPAEAQRELAQYLGDPSPTGLLVLVAARPIPKLAQAVRGAGRVIDAGRGRRGDVLTWLREQSRKAGLKASSDALNALLEAVGEERMALARALEELALAFGSGSAEGRDARDARDARIGAEEVRRQFRGRADVRIFGFVDAVADRQTGPALEALHRLVRQGEAPYALFWTLSRHFRQLLSVGDQGPALVARSLGMPDWRAEKLVRQARGFPAGALVRAYRALADADRRMKRSEGPEMLSLERAVVAITTG